MQAWQANLKGVATYRPNAILGSVLQVTPEHAAISPVTSPHTTTDPSRQVHDRRPLGELPVVAENHLLDAGWHQNGESQQ